jgi:hypothetical protein
MTLDDVQRAQADLESQHVYPSATRLVMDGGAHGAPRVALYRGRRLALCCADCLGPIKVWDVRAYMQEAP